MRAPHGEAHGEGTDVAWVCCFRSGGTDTTSERSPRLVIVEPSLSEVATTVPRARIVAKRDLQRVRIRRSPEARVYVVSLPPHWALRGRLSPEMRHRARRAVDGVLAGPLGSWRATTSTTQVALTFDDGPDPEVTPRLLDLLDEVRAPSTFFLLVNQCRAWPTLAREIASRGHEVALHGYDHSRLTSLARGEITRHLVTAKVELEQLTEQPVTLYRPPYGAQSVRTYLATRRAGLEVVVWSADAEDWVDGAVAEVVERGLVALRPGGILLLHERLEPDPLRGAPITTFDRADVARGIIDRCRQRGLEPGTVGEVVQGSSAVRSAWFRP